MGLGNLPPLDKPVFKGINCTTHTLACMAGARKGKGEGKIGRARSHPQVSGYRSFVFHSQSVFTPSFKPRFIVYCFVSSFHPSTLGSFVCCCRVAERFIRHIDGFVYFSFVS